MLLFIRDETRKRLFGSEYVFKIEYLINVKRVEGDEILDNIKTYQGNVPVSYTHLTLPTKA